MHPSDIPDLVAYELQGEQWTEEDLLNALGNLYDGGGGSFDPYTLVAGKDQSCDDSRGWATERLAATKPYTDLYLAVASRNLEPGLAGQFLRWAAQHDDSAPCVEEMTQAVNRQPIELPTIEEEVPEDTEPKP